MLSPQKWIESKQNKKKITMVTCYDYSFAKILNQTGVDVLLIGDSSEMVIYGQAHTLGSDVNKLATLTSAVRLGAPDKFIVTDVPFGLMQAEDGEFFRAIKAFMQSGANAIKIEGVNTYEERFAKLSAMGVPVMGHLGLTPQHIQQFGGFKVQGKTEESRKKIVEQAIKLEHMGAFAMVLECVPSELARVITAEVAIPTIGIGAGKDVDGQVLVLQDLLGFNPDFKPKFVRHYLNGFQIVSEAINSYVNDVKGASFPSEVESYEL